MTLDGLRGVAALSIVAAHAHRYFEDPLPWAGMGVDVFYVLSGFVLAHSYEQRFRDGLSASDFMRRRFARLYPLYLVGTALGVVEAVLAIRYHYGIVVWGWHRFFVALPFAVTMVPNPFRPDLYPFDPALWTLFFELVVNLLWVLSWRRLESTRVLIAVVACLGMAFFIAAVHFHSTGIGFPRSTFAGGFVRVSYEFLLGVLFYRLRSSLRVPRLSPILPIVALPIIAAFGPNRWGELVVVMIVLPLVVLLATRTEPTGALGRTCAALGLASFAMYTTHAPLYALSYGVLREVLHVDVGRLTPWIGFAFVAALIPLCVGLAERFDAPARRRLHRLIAPRER